MKEEELAIFLEDFCDFLDGLEDSIAKMKQQIAKLVGVSQEIKKEKAEVQDVKADVKAEVKRVWSWNPDTIRWVKVQGVKGLFEKSEDVNNPEFKLLLKDLANHNGRLTRNGYFYWTFKNGATVGRKKRG